MEWLKKKKDEAKQAAAKLQNKRTAFKGEGNTLGGEGAQSAAPADANNSHGKGFKVPFVKQAPPPISDEEKERRREMQTKAAEARVNAWDKRVNTARKVRLQQEEELETKFGLPQPPPASSSTDNGITAPHPPANVLSNEEVKRREMANAQAQLGFNPYAPVFSSSTEVGAATNAIGGAGGGGGTNAGPSTMPPPAPSSISSSTAAPSSGEASEHGAVYVLLRQEPPRAITAAETIIKMLSNILQNPQEDKFRRVRLANASIQSKLVAVAGALDILREAGFRETQENSENFLVLTAGELNAKRVQSAVDRTEVALIQLRVDSVGV